MPNSVKSSLVNVGTDFQTNFPPNAHYRLTHAETKWLAVSDGHYGFPDFPRNRNIGGAFVLRGADTTHTPTENTEFWRGGTNQQFYKGFFIASIDPYQIPSTSITDIDGSARVAEAYKRMKPTKPVFTALNSMYELKDVPGMLRQRFLNSGISSIGNYYLALKFGWEPLLRDIRNMVSFQRDAQKRLAWLLKHNGRPVRRSVKILDTVSNPVKTSGFLYGALQPVLVTQYYVTQPFWRQTTQERDRIWASARFRFWLPGGPRDIAWQRKMMARLYGLTPTPSVIYNMIPWSWLVDWFSNLGDLIENIDGGVADRLAADYIYLMRNREWSSERFVQGRFRKRSGQTFDVAASAITRSFTKTRVRGGPFDPAILEKDLNGTQLAIMGALGLSRMG